MRTLPILATLLPLTPALVVDHTRLSPSPRPLPLLIWHGLGDKYDNPGLHDVGALAADVHPGTFVYYIRLDDDASNDRSATFFGNVTAQVEQVCAALAAEPALLDPTTERMRVDALGFSQGGQFLRALVQQCAGLRVRALVTFGSQHNGITGVRPCGTFDLLCKAAVALMRGNVWAPAVQGRVVPAQYFRSVDPDALQPSDDYLNHSAWLADVNNERETKKEIYARRMAQLDKFVMFVFNDDTTVVPKESGWFAEVNGTSGDVTPLRKRSLYKEDWLGLKELDEKGGLVFKSHPGDHMQLDSDILEKTFKEYFGPEYADESGRDVLAGDVSGVESCSRQSWAQTMLRWTWTNVAGPHEIL